MLDPHMGNYSCIETAMNLRTWNNLPADITGIISQVSKEVLEKSIEIMMADENRDMEKMHTDWNANLYVLPPDQVEKWKARILPIHDEFIAELEKKGLPGKDFFDSYKALANKYEKDSTYTSTYERWLKKYGE